MPTTPPPTGDAPSAAELNARIRALWSHPAVRLTDEQRAEYQRLLAALSRVQRGEIVEAA